MAFHPTFKSTTVDVNTVRDTNDRRCQPVALRMEDVPSELLLGQERGFFHKLFDSPQVLIASLHELVSLSIKRSSSLNPSILPSTAGTASLGSP